MRHTIYSKLLIVGLMIVAGAIAVDAQGTVTEKLLPVIAASPTPIEASAFAGLTPGPDGRLYGVTYSGGSADFGILYSIDPAVTGITTHYNFVNGADGGVAYDELVFDSVSGKFYGTTSQGGSLGLGTVFSYVPGANSITTLRSDFNGPYQAQGPLTISSGYIFGSLGRNGANGGGAVFRMAIDGGGLVILHDFADFGSLPQALTLGPDGWLYGVTIYGGVPCPTQPTLGCGTIFRLRRVLPGDTNVNFQTLYQFQYYRTVPCPPGDPWCVPSAPVAHNHPQRTVIYGSDGWIYGQTFQRNFRIDPAAGNPASTFQFIGGFTGGVSLTTIEGSDGRLYVADYGGGSEGAGEIFSMNRDGTGKVVLRDFSFSAGLRSYGPYGRLLRTSSGMIYGTTEYTDITPFGGTVFSIGPEPSLTGKIVFGSDRDGNDEIYSMNADGSGVLRLTTNNATESFPSITASGNKIAFVSDRNGIDQIFSMNPDGSNVVALTDTASRNTHPTFSPDGQKIAFVSNRNGNLTLYVMNSDGTGQTRVTNFPTGVDGHPSFSNDGSTIAFTSTRPGSGEDVYKIGINGLGELRLTTDAAGDSDPSFSPDGSKIVFTSMRHGSAQIYIMNADGSSQTRLTNNAFIDLEPVFSPDGGRVAFTSFRDGNAEIYRMNVNGTGQVRVTTNAARDSLPSWGGVFTPTPPPAVKMKIDSGNILIGSPGEGIILKSPNGTTCLKIGIDNAGAMTTVIMPCP